MQHGVPRSSSGRRVARLAALASLGALAACAGTMPTAAVQPGPAKPSPVQQTAGLRDVPPCPDNVSATLTSGLTVHFDGAAHDDPDVCIQRWDAKTHRYYLGFWGHGRFRAGTEEERRAITAALQAPVGTSVRFTLPRKTRLSMWKSATVQHVANDRLLIGNKPRPAVTLRVVMHDALGREDVKAENLYWIDRETGVPLRKEVVTRTADGDSWHTTIWQVSSLHGEG